MMVVMLQRTNIQKQIFAQNYELHGGLFECFLYVRPTYFYSLFKVTHVISAIIMTSIEHLKTVFDSRGLWTRDLSIMSKQKISSYQLSKCLSFYYLLQAIFFSFIDAVCLINLLSFSSVCFSVLNHTNTYKHNSVAKVEKLPRKCFV